jgi:hypothetical protein
MKFPSMPAPLMPHLVRGLWESDGASYVTHGNLWMAYTTASECFANTLAVVIGLMTGACTNVSETTQTKWSVGNKAYHVRYSGESARVAAKWMYADATPGSRCERKWNIVREHIATTSGV